MAEKVYKVNAVDISGSPSKFDEDACQFIFASVIYAWQFIAPAVCPDNAFATHLDFISTSEFLLHCIQWKEEFYALGF